MYYKSLVFATFKTAFKIKLVMLLVDVHCHLMHEMFKKDLNQVIESAKKNNVKAIITSGVNTPTNREALELAEKYPDIIKCSLGVYPVDALGVIEGDESGLTRAIAPMNVDEEIEFIAKNKNKIIAVGEAGLDFKIYNKEEQVIKQKENFMKVIELCEKIKKPLVVHSRRAEKECVEMLETSTLRRVDLHCFEGNKKIIKKAEELGYCFSIPPLILKLQHFQTMTEMVDINQLLTETDAPWLSGIPGERNEPSFVERVIKKIAEIKKMTSEDVANNIFMNYQRTFL